MCLTGEMADPVLQAEVASFADWILSIGDGTAPSVARQREHEPSWITIPNDMSILRII